MFNESILACSKNSTTTGICPEKTVSTPTFSSTYDASLSSSTFEQEPTSTINTYDTTIKTSVAFNNATGSLTNTSPQLLLTTRTAIVSISIISSLKNKSTTLISDKSTEVDNTILTSSHPPNTSQSKNWPSISRGKSNRISSSAMFSTSDTTENLKETSIFDNTSTKKVDISALQNMSTSIVLDSTSKITQSTSITPIIHIEQSSQPRTSTLSDLEYDYTTTFSSTLSTTETHSFEATDIFGESTDKTKKISSSSKLLLTSFNKSESNKLVIDKLSSIKQPNTTSHTTRLNSAPSRSSISSIIFASSSESAIQNSVFIIDGKLFISTSETFQNSTSKNLSEGHLKSKELSVTTNSIYASSSLLKKSVLSTTDSLNIKMSTIETSKLCQRTIEFNGVK